MDGWMDGWMDGGREGRKEGRKEGKKDDLLEYWFMRWPKVRSMLHPGG